MFISGIFKKSKSVIIRKNDWNQLSGSYWILEDNVHRPPRDLSDWKMIYNKAAEINDLVMQGRASSVIETFSEDKSE